MIGDDAVLASGLVGGERVVLTDLVPAVPGMLLLFWVAPWNAVPEGQQTRG